MYDLITIGVVTLDHFAKIHDASVHCAVNKSNCKITMNFADKIPIDEFDSIIGGNGANNAVGSSRLGLKAGIYTVYGSDQTGDVIEKTFQDEHVDTTYAVREKAAKSDTALVIRFQEERTILVYHEKREYHFPELAPTKWLYYTSLMKGFEHIHQDLITYIKKNNVKLAFNPGTHQLIYGKNNFKDILEVTELLIVNKEEAQRFLEVTTNDIKDLLFGLKHLGPKNVMITDGPQGSYGFDGLRCMFLDVFPGPVVERTGAGDSYSTGAIAAFIQGGDMQNAMVWGTFNGWSVVQKVGPQAGLLTKTEMEKLIRDHPELRPKIL